MAALAPGIVHRAAPESEAVRLIEPTPGMTHVRVPADSRVHRGSASRVPVNRSCRDGGAAFVRSSGLRPSAHGSGLPTTLSDSGISTSIEVARCPPAALGRLGYPRI